MADDTAPAEQDQPIDAPEAPETDQPTGGEEESFTDSYNPSELPENVRPHVEAAYKQLQGAYTQKTQSLAAERREAEQAQRLIESLQDPQIAPAALAQLGYDERKLLELYGYQVGDDEPDDDFDEEFRDPRVDALLADRQAETRQGEVTRYVESEIEALAKKRGSEISDDEQAALDFIGQGLSGKDVPDVQAADKFLEGVVKARVKEILKPKTPTRRPGSGAPGSRTVDLSKETPEERLERLEHVADQARGSLAA